MKTFKVLTRLGLVTTLLLAFSTVFSTRFVQGAATYFWDNNGATALFGTAAGTWAATTTGSSTQGWSTNSGGTAVPGSITTTTSDLVNFGTSTSSSLLAGTVTVSGTVAAGSITFGSGAGAIVLSGGTIGFSTVTPTITVSNTSDTISSSLTGSAGIIKSGSGILQLTGVSAYTGSTSISAGTLQLSGTGSLGTTYAGGISIASGSVLQDSSTATQTLSGNITGLGGLTYDAASNASLTLSGVNTYSGPTTIKNKARLTAAPGALSANTTITIIGTATNGGQYFVSGSGGTVTNNFIISGLGYTETNANASHDGAIRVNSGAAFTGSITLTADSRIGTVNAGSSSTFSGQITGSGALDFYMASGTNSITQTYILANTGTANNYTGNTSVTLVNFNATNQTGDKMVLQLGASDQVPNGAGAGNLVLNGADAGHLTIFELNGFNETVNGISNANVAGASIQNTSTGASTFTVGDANTSSSYSGVLTDGGTGKTLALTKIGTGSLTLSGTNSYIGATTVTAGTLVLSGTGAINNTSGITLNSATAIFLQNSSVAVSPTVTLTQGTVTGSGTINTVNVGAGGVVSNNNGVAGASLTVGTLTFNGAATVNTYSSNTSAPLVTTTLATNAAGIVTINPTATSWTNGATYTLISYSGGSIGGAGFGQFALGAITGLNSRQMASALTDTGSALTVSITGDAPVWTGAGDGNWNLASANNWKLITAGTPTTFLAADTVFFDDTATPAGPLTVNIDTANVSPGSTTFNNNTKAYTLNSTGGFGIASGSLTMNGTGSVTIATANTYTGSTTINAGTLILSGVGTLGTGSALTMSGGQLDLGTTSQTVSAVSITAAAVSGDTIKNGSLTGSSYAASNTSGNVVISANLLANGTAGLAVSGSGGTVTLTGANTFTGTTTVAAGATLQVGNGSTTGAFLSTSLVNSGTVIFNRSDAITPTYSITGTGAVLLKGPGTVTLPVTSNSYSGGTTISQGQLTASGGTGTVGTGTITLGDANSGSNPITLWADTGNLTNNIVVSNQGTGLVTLTCGTTGGFATGTVTLNRDVTITSNADNRPFTSVIAGTGNVTIGGINRIQIQGSGLTNTWVGNFTIAANAYLQINNSGSGNVNVIPDAANANISGKLEFFSGSGATTGEVVNALSGAATGIIEPNSTYASGKIATLTVGQNNGSGTYNGIITQGASVGLMALTKAGTGTQTLTGVNNYAGVTTISGGTLQLSGTGSLGSGAYSKTISIASGAVFQFSSSAAQTLSGVISGAGTVTKDTSSGALVLSAANTYSGATNINAGTLTVSNTTGSGTGTSLVSVNSGGTLNGTGTISGAVTVFSGGNIAPGNTAGTLNLTGGLALSSGSLLTYDLDTTPGGSNDLLAVTGNLSLATATLNINATGGDVGLGTYKLITYTGSLTGDTTGWTIGNNNASGSYLYSFSTATANEVDLIVAASSSPTGSGTWKNGSTDGKWTTNTGANNNWATGIPLVMDNVATFDDTVTGMPGTVDLNGNQTVGAVAISTTTHGYTLGLANTANTLTLQVSSGTASITTTGGGSHTINAKVVAASNTTISVAGTSSLNLVQGIDNSGNKNIALTQAGTGTLSAGNINNGTTGTVTVTGTVAADTISGSGTTTVTNNSLLTVNNITGSTPATGGAVSIQGTNANASALLTMNATPTAAPTDAGSGGASGTMVLSSLSISNAYNPANGHVLPTTASPFTPGSALADSFQTYYGTLDLQNNNLVVAMGQYSQIQDMARSASHIAFGGTWDGTGLTSSWANQVAPGGGAANHFNGSTALGVIINNGDQTEDPAVTPFEQPLYAATGASLGTTFEGYAGLTGNETLVKYTWVGDANLDGVVDLADYNLFAAGVSGATASDGLPGWYFGDFNYDGVVDLADYNLLAAGISASNNGTISLPEPSTFVLAAFGLLGLLVARRRKLA